MEEYCAWRITWVLHPQIKDSTAKFDCEDQLRWTDELLSRQTTLSSVNPTIRNLNSVNSCVQVTQKQLIWQYMSFEAGKTTDIRFLS